MSKKTKAAKAAQPAPPTNDQAAVIQRVLQEYQAKPESVPEASRRVCKKIMEAQGRFAACEQQIQQTQARLNSLATQRANLEGGIGHLAELLYEEHSAQPAIESDPKK